VALSAGCSTEIDIWRNLLVVDDALLEVDDEGRVVVVGAQAPGEGAIQRTRCLWT
jgi:hypothetical protein